MNALLGKITRIEKAQTQDNSTRDGEVYALMVKPLCVLPRRTAVPEWLNDQSLSITRTVPDVRELGGAGDSIILTIAESAPLIAPLVALPALSYDALPEQIHLKLHWWKDDKPPVAQIAANGRTQSIEWAKSENGDGYTAQFETNYFFATAPTLPVHFAITCDKLKISAATLPAATNHFYPVPDGKRERYQSENHWFRVRIAPDTFAAGVVSLIEKARGTDYFAAPASRIQFPLEKVGQSDILRSGWNSNEAQIETALTIAGSRRDGEGARLSLEGQIEDNLRTSVAYTLLDSLPLLLIQRDYQFAKGDDSKDKAKDKKPKEPIDEIKPIRTSIRVSVPSESKGLSGIRVLTSDGERLVTLRTAETNDNFDEHYWRMRDGWSLIEDSERHFSLLQLFDTHHPPRLWVFHWANSFTAEMGGNDQPIRPPQSLGYTVALAGGELCGASDNGAWVACRSTNSEKGTRIGIVARLRDLPTDADVALRRGGETQTVPLGRVAVTGIGTIYTAVATFAANPASSDFETDITVAGIPTRRNGV